MNCRPCIDVRQIARKTFSSEIHLEDLMEELDGFSDRLERGFVKGPQQGHHNYMDVRLPWNIEELLDGDTMIAWVRHAWLRGEKTIDLQLVWMCSVHNLLQFHYLAI